MSYENNRIKCFLERNSILKVESKTTSSVYYYFKSFSVRYSNHVSTGITRYQQYDVVRTAERVMILPPEEKEYIRFNEKTGYYYIRRIYRDSKIKFNAFSSKKGHKYLTTKRRQQESRKMKVCLGSLKGQSLKTLNMNQT